MGTFLIVVLLILLAYKYRTNLLGLVNKEVATVETKASAFAKVAEIDGKLIALKTTADVKKAEALAVHDSLDEIHNILG